MKIIFLGTGTSHGVPHIDCVINNFINCTHGICKDTEKDKKHRRTRSSILIEIKNKNILIDTSMDFRYQMLRAKTKNIDAVLYTHSHADHIYGLPDIRSYSRLHKNGINIYGSSETIEMLQYTFGFIFRPPEYEGGGIAKVIPNIVEKETNILGIDVIPIPVTHGILEGCLGYRINDIAYIPDVKEIPETSIEKLKNLKILILNGLRHSNHSSHLSLKESVELVKKIKPERCYLTHMTHNIHYIKDRNKILDNMDFSYDTLEIEC